MPSLKRTHIWNPAARRAFILDWDGVLAETKLSFAHIRQKYFQGRFVPLFESIATLPHEASVALERDIYDEEMRGAESAEAVPGALDLLDWLESERIPWCVVSRNCHDSIRLAAERGRTGECYILSGYEVTVKELLDEISLISGKKPIKTNKDCPCCFLVVLAVWYNG